MFLDGVSQDDKDQLVARYPNIIDIVEGANIITSSLASKLSRSMRIFAEIYDKYNHYL